MGFNSLVVFPNSCKATIVEDIDLGKKIHDSIAAAFGRGRIYGVKKPESYVFTNCEHADGYSFVLTYKDIVINLGRFYYLNIEKMAKKLKMESGFARDLFFSPDSFLPNSNLVLNFLNDGIHLVDETEYIGKSIYDKYSSNMEAKAIHPDKRWYVNLDTSIKGFCNPITIVDAPNPDKITISWIGQNYGGRLGVIERENPDEWANALFDTNPGFRYRDIYDPEKVIREMIKDTDDLLKLRNFDKKQTVKKNKGK